MFFFNRASDEHEPVNAVPSKRLRQPFVPEVPRTAKVAVNVEFVAAVARRPDQNVASASDSTPDSDTQQVFRWLESTYISCGIKTKRQAFSIIRCANGFDLPIAVGVSNIFGDLKGGMRIICANPHTATSAGLELVRSRRRTLSQKNSTQRLHREGLPRFVPRRNSTFPSLD